jgi:hypothetical protein
MRGQGESYSDVILRLALASLEREPTQKSPGVKGTQPRGRGARRGWGTDIGAPENQTRPAPDCSGPFAKSVNFAPHGRRAFKPLEPGPRFPLTLRGTGPVRGGEREIEARQRGGADLPPARLRRGPQHRERGNGVAVPCDIAVVVGARRLGKGRIAGQRPKRQDRNVQLSGHLQLGFGRQSRRSFPPLRRLASISDTTA